MKPPSQPVSASERDSWVSPPATSAPKLFTLLDAFVLFTIFLVGLIHLPFNLFSDQALFAVGARMMDRGAVLYRDFWDIKQPGIYGFYWLGGRLFGFDEIGIHAFELLYMLAFAFLSISILKSYFRLRWAASLVPLLTVGVYYAVSRDLHLTQVEALVGAPLLIACWGAMKATTGQRSFRYLFLSGLAGGVVVGFKFVLAPIVVGFWVVALVYQLLSRRKSLVRTVAEIALPTALGVLVPLLLICAYFFRKHTLGTLYYHTFVYPAQVMKVMPRPGFGRLFHSAHWFVQSFAPVLALAFVGAATALSRKKDAMTLSLIGWIASAWVVIIIQGLSWWEYHFMLFFVPLGILAAKGIEFVWGQVDAAAAGHAHLHSRILAQISIGLLFLPMIMNLTWKAVTIARHRFALTPQHRCDYHASIDPRYREWLSAAEFVTRPDAAPGAVFIFGEPLLYYLSEREPALTMTTPDGQVMTPKAWAELTQELKQKSPVYLFVEDSSPEYELRSNSPQTFDVVQSAYHVVHTDRLGTWYMRNGAAGDKSAAFPAGEPLGIRAGRFR